MGTMEFIEKLVGEAMSLKREGSTDDMSSEKTGSMTTVERAEGTGRKSLGEWTLGRPKEVWGMVQFGLGRGKGGGDEGRWKRGWTREDGPSGRTVQGRRSLGKEKTTERRKEMATQFTFHISENFSPPEAIPLPVSTLSGHTVKI